MMLTDIQQDALLPYFNVIFLKQDVDYLVWVLEEETW